MNRERRTLILSQWLDFTLERNIKALKGETEMADSFSFKELAEDMKASKASMIDRGKALRERMNKVNTRVDAGFRKHEGALDDAEEGAKFLEEAARDLEGNGGETEGSEKSDTFRPEGETERKG